MCDSNLCVPHAGGCNESLLQSLVLQSTVLLLPLRAPLQLQQVLDNVYMSSESSVNQPRLTALICMINLVKIQQDNSRRRRTCLVDTNIIHGVTYSFITLCSHLGPTLA